MIWNQVNQRIIITINTIIIKSQNWKILLKFLPRADSFRLKLQIPVLKICLLLPAFQSFWYFLQEQRFSRSSVAQNKSSMSKETHYNNCNIMTLPTMYFTFLHKLCYAALNQESGTYGSRAKYGSSDDCVWLSRSQTNLDKLSSKLTARFTTCFI